MKKSVFLVFGISLLFLFLLVGVMIGRNAKSVYALLDTAPDTAYQTQSMDPENIGKLDINKATAEQLRELSGIGEVIADRIIEYRRENGRFDSIYDLLKVDGIGEKKFDEFMDSIYAGG